MQHSMARTLSRPLAGIIEDIEREDDAEGYEDAFGDLTMGRKRAEHGRRAPLAPEVLRSMWTADLYAARADAGFECLQPTFPDAIEAVRDLLCASCPLTGLCTTIREREGALGAYAPAVADDLAAHRNTIRGVQPALGWGEAA